MEVLVRKCVDFNNNAVLYCLIMTYGPWMNFSSSSFSAEPVHQFFRTEGTCGSWIQKSMQFNHLISLCGLHPHRQDGKKASDVASHCMTTS